MFTENDSPALPAHIGDLLAGWGQAASDPLLSEHTLLQLQNGKGVYRIGTGPIDAIVTLVAASDGTGGLIEVAGATAESRRNLWEAMAPEIVAEAEEHAFDPLVLIDRDGLESGEDSVGAIVRMRIGAESIESVPAGERMTQDDLEDILAVINLAFEGHPENGNWTMGDLTARIALPWFDPGGFLVERSEGGVVAGFCWTKVHADGVGEIYLLAVHPDLAGRGSGKDLATRGMAYLRDEAKCPEVIVYSAGDNFIARGLYESLGFAVDRIDHRVAIKRY